MGEKLVTVGMLIFIMLGLSGCANRHEKNNEEMLAHMKEKYGVEFEIQNYIPRNVDCSYDVWFCNAVGDDPEQDRIEVHRYYGELANDGEYADEYYSRLVRDEVESRATEALLQVVNEAKVYLSEYSFAEEEYTEADQLDEYLQTEEGQYAFGMLIYIADQADSELSDQQIVSNVEKSLIAAGVGYPTVRVFFINNMELYDSLNRESQEQLIFRSGKEKNYRCDYTISLAKLE